MADDSGEELEDELSIIKAIFPELVISSSDRAQIDIEVAPLQPLPVRFSKPKPSDGDNSSKDDSTAGDSKGATLLPLSDGTDIIAHNVTRDLSFLPPLSVVFQLPPEYPSQVPPLITVNSTWLSPSILQKYAEDAVRLWEEMGHAQILFAYIDFLRDSAENAFGLLSGDRTQLNFSSELEVSLLDFDLKAKRVKFERETFECGICLEPKKGSSCHRLTACGHVFCVECLRDFYNTCITEGDVGKVACTAPGCGDDAKALPQKADMRRRKSRRRDDRTLEPSELYQIPLEQDMIQRYTKLKRKKMLESDRRTIYCPRQWCQGPARSQRNKFKPVDADESDVEDDHAEPESYDPNSPEKLPPPAERLAICEDCNFAFCKVCKASWHGEYYTCFPRSQFELTAEERASEDYMKIHTQACPTCDARAQKTHGCNHMICFKCNTHFCYLCGAYLEVENPYKHYNQPNKGCYMRLWELEAGDGADIGQGFAGGGGGILMDDIIEDDDGDDHAPIIEHGQGMPNDRGAAEGQQQNGNGHGNGNGNPGLQHFLQLVRNDAEDEWDSDEMDDDDGWER